MGATNSSIVAPYLLIKSRYSRYAKKVWPFLLPSAAHTHVYFCPAIVCRKGGGLKLEQDCSPGSGYRVVTRCETMQGGASNGR